VITSKDLAIDSLGLFDVRTYEIVKAFYMRLGEELARLFAEAVDGTVGLPGENDVLTRLGGFEFCASHNTKNHAGALVDQIRGRRVQATGRARPGFLSGEEFLAIHGVDESLADDIRRRAADNAKDGITAQQRLPV